MDIRNGLITTYAGISASLGSSGQFTVSKTTGSYFTILNNGRAWFGNGTPVDAGYQMDIAGTTRVQGAIYTTFGANSLNIIANTATGTQTADRGILIGAASSFTGSSVVSTAIGHGTTIGAGTGNLALGHGSSANSAGIAIGGPGGIGATANGGIAVGGGAVSNGGISIGSNNSTVNGGGIAIGATALSSATNAIAVGNSVLASGSFSIAIGDRCSVPTSHSAAIVLGLFARSTNSRQFIIGGNDASNLYSVNDVYIGGGVQDLNGGNAGSVTINASGGGNTTNATGGSIRIAGGKGTGNALPGDIIFATSVTGSSGTTLQTLTDRWYIKGHTGTLTNKSTALFSGPSWSLDVSGTQVLSGSTLITGSVIVTGSIFMSTSSSFVLPLTASSAPQTGSAFWSGSFLFVFNGLKYVSSSFA